MSKNFKKGAALKRKYTISFLILVLAIAFAGCAHDCPKGEGIGPTLVEVETEVTLDLVLVPLQTVTNKARSGTTRAEAQPEYRRRFIVEAWREGKPVARQVTVLEEAEEDGEDITLPARLKLPAVQYTLVVWTDYVAAGTDIDLYYDTRDLQRVACRAPYAGSTDYRDCLYGTASLDLWPYRDEWNARVQVWVDMVRPLAKYELVATDVQKFLEKARRRSGEGGEGTYTVTVSYGFYIPLGFNVLTGTPDRSEMGVTFSAPFTVTGDGSGACTIASDYIFVNGEEAYIPLSIEIKDDDGNGISRTTGIDVPYRRGHLTTVRGHFLTNRYGTGIGIDPDFDDDDIEIDLDKWE